MGNLQSNGSNRFPTLSDSKQEVEVDDYEGAHNRWGPWFNNRDLSDVTFESRDGRLFHCHKLVLAVASQYFKKKFLSRDYGKQGKRQFVQAPFVDSAALEWVLRACYTGDGELNNDNVVDVLMAARLYDMKWISDACVQYILDQGASELAAFEYSRDNEKWQLWEVPESKWYFIVAAGAKARDRLSADALGVRVRGGQGAIVAGAFQLNKGDMLHILTGATPTQYKSPIHLGGAGGSFVSLNKKKLLLAAGGGGPPGGQGSSHYGSPANLGESGIGSWPTHKGGTNGGNGQNNAVNIGGLGWNAGYDALAKPSSNNPEENGGFGGGGDYAGGGGGYSGGSATYNSGAGGGGSYVSGDAINAWKQLGSSGDGRVSIWDGKEQPNSKAFFSWLAKTHSLDKEEIKVGNVALGQPCTKAKNGRYVRMPSKA